MSRDWLHLREIILLFNYMTSRNRKGQIQPHTRTLNVSVPTILNSPEWIVLDPKIYAIEILQDSNYLLIAGDHTYTPPISTKKNKRITKQRESFISLHEISKGFPLLQTFRFEQVASAIVNLSVDPGSGIIIASDAGSECLFFR